MQLAITIEVPTGASISQLLSKMKMPQHPQETQQLNDNFEIDGTNSMKTTQLRYSGARTLEDSAPNDRNTRISCEVHPYLLADYFFEDDDDDLENMDDIERYLEAMDMGSFSSSSSRRNSNDGCSETKRGQQKRVCSNRN